MIWRFRTYCISVCVWLLITGRWTRIDCCRACDQLWYRNRPNDTRANHDHSRGELSMFQSWFELEFKWIVSAHPREGRLFVMCICMSRPGVHHNPTRLKSFSVRPPFLPPIHPIHRTHFSPIETILNENDLKRKGRLKTLTRPQLRTPLFPMSIV